MLTVPTLAQAIGRMHARRSVIREQLDAADRLLGDGDTGMTVAAVLDAWQGAASALPDDVGEALQELGRAAARVSGSSLGAVLAMGLGAAGRIARGSNSLGRDAVVTMLAAASRAIMERSGASAGDKSILDSLVRIEQEVRAAPTAAELAPLSLRAAQAALDEFRDRMSLLGRARIYGAKSIGHDDPGMKAVELLLDAAAIGIHHQSGGTVAGNEKIEEGPAFDVIVAGGGVAGVVAAIAAARTGARTLVIEKLNTLGGNFTSGLMGTTWTLNDENRLVVKGIPLEIIQRLKKLGAVVSNDIARDAFTIYDTELAKFVLFEMAEECGLNVLLHTFVADALVENNAVKGIVIQSKSGRQLLRAKVVVDCSGDADVAALAGAPFDLPAKEKLHPASLLAKLGGVDVDELSRFYAKHPEYKGNFTHGQQHPGFHAFKLTGVLDEAHRKGLLPKEYEYLRDWFVLFYSTPRPGEMTINMTGEVEVDGTNVWDLTRAEIVSRKRLLQVLDCFRRFMPGFQNAYIMTTGLLAGIRETRRIIGEYMLTRDDILNARKFPDAVSSYAAPIGQHTPDGKDAEFHNLKPGRSYDFPYRVLLPQKIDNLLVAGRCISVAADCIGSTRNMTSCMTQGQSAGTAAALAARMGVTPRALDVKLLQRELVRQGAYIDRVSEQLEEQARLTGMATAAD